ncbi:MAG: hypothetical protein ABI895_42205, partial [Deltaproteobacteria bacterium]
GSARVLGIERALSVARLRLVPEVPVSVCWLRPGPSHPPGGERSRSLRTLGFREADVCAVLV